MKCIECSTVKCEDCQKEIVGASSVPNPVVVSCNVHTPTDRYSLVNYPYNNYYLHNSAAASPQIYIYIGKYCAYCNLPMGY